MLPKPASTRAGAAGYLCRLAIPRERREIRPGREDRNQRMLASLSVPPDGGSMTLAEMLYITSPAYHNTSCGGELDCCHKTEVPRDADAAHYQNKGHWFCSDFV